MQKKGRSLDDFRGAHDKSFIVPNKIKAGLEELGDSWEYEADFAKRCGVTISEMSQYRNGFEKNFLQLRVNGKPGKRCWAGTPSYLEKLKNMVR